MAIHFEAKANVEVAALFEADRVVGDDRTLLDRFRRDGSPSAFEGLVVRHGGLVRGVCRRVLGDGPDLDDAFQATFLVLARRAGEVRNPDRLGPWLYGVAARVALKARTRRARRREVALEPSRLDRAERTQTSPEVVELMAIFDAELARVPGKLRDAVVLCLLEGVTVEEAATRLACPVGTVKSRLARGRAALQSRLIRRGITPSLAAATLASPLAAADAALVASASIPVPLIRATLALSLAPAASVAPRVATLARGVAPAMMTKLTIATSALVLGGFALAGTYLAAAPQDPTSSPPRTSRPGTSSAGPDARTVARDHLKQLARAFLDATNTDPKLRFPAPAILGVDGQPNLSWRVTLLPFLGEGALYNEFHRDEPWNSPHNKPLIDRMPAVFESPDSPAPAGMTRFRGFATPGSVFEGPEGTTLRSITDGTNHTILVAQTAEPVEWTKPGEVEGPESRDFKALTGIQWRFLMADGSVRDMAPTALELLGSMISRNGGEATAWLNGPASQRRPATPESTLSGTKPSDLEDRLRRVEEKLDRLIERIEANGGAGQPTPKR